MKETIVTGANGFIGSHLTARLERFTAIPHAQIQKTTLPAFDTLYFLSAYGNMYDQQNANETVKGNVSDLTHLLGQLETLPPFKSLVYVSTSSVRLERQTMYSRTKKAAEEILLAYKEKFDLPICIIRPFSVTGVGEQPKHLIPTLIRSCLTGEKMDFAPRPVHDFIDVEDVVDGILNLADHSAKGVFELGTGKSYTNQEVKDIVERVTGKRANVNEVDRLRDYDIRRGVDHDWVSANFRARVYGWLPKKSLEQSITEMVEAHNEG